MSVVLGWLANMPRLGWLVRRFSRFGTANRANNSGAEDALGQLDEGFIQENDLNIAIAGLTQGLGQVFDLRLPFGFDGNQVGEEFEGGPQAPDCHPHVVDMLDVVTRPHPFNFSGDGF